MACGVWRIDGEGPHAHSCGPCQGMPSTVPVLQTQTLRLVWKAVAQDSVCSEPSMCNGLHVCHTARSLSSHLSALHCCRALCMACWVLGAAWCVLRAPRAARMCAIRCAWRQCQCRGTGGGSNAEPGTRPRHRARLSSLVWLRWCGAARYAATCALDAGSHRWTAWSRLYPCACGQHLSCTGVHPNTGARTTPCLAQTGCCHS